MAQARRIRGTMPFVWASWRRGDIDRLAGWKIDQTASRLTSKLSVAELDDRAVTYAATHTTRQLQSWLNRFVARTEPNQHTTRRRRADLYADLLIGRIDVEGTETERGSGVTIGITVPISTVLGLDDTPGELLDRSAAIPADIVRELCRHEGTLFQRLLTDRAGNLLDVTEMGRYPSAKLRYALDVRDGQCRFPNCTAPAERSDKDHDLPLPEGPTNADNLKNLCRRHHRIKTHGIAHTINQGGRYRWRMPTGSVHDCPPMQQPVRRQHDFSHGEAALRRLLADAGPNVNGPP